MSRKKRERQAREKKKRKALEKATRKPKPISSYEVKFVVTAPKLNPATSYVQGGY